jgi:hypothetical protein
LLKSVQIGGVWHIHFPTSADARRCHLVMDSKFLHGQKLVLTLKSELCSALVGYDRQRERERERERIRREKRLRESEPLSARDRRLVDEAARRIRQALLDAFLEDVTNRVISSRIFEFYESAMREAHAKHASQQQQPSLSALDEPEQPQATSVADDDHDAVQDEEGDAAEDSWLDHAHIRISSVINTLPRFKRRTFNALSRRQGKLRASLMALCLQCIRRLSIDASR